MIPTCPHRAAGFSLIEVMCAVLILGVGIVGLTQGITSALQSNKDIERQTNAALLAAGKIETLRAGRFLLEGETEGDGEQELAAYGWRQSISSTQTEGLYEVSVAILHASTGKTIYELQTLLFDPPVSSDLDEPETTTTTRSRTDEERRPR